MSVELAVRASRARGQWVIHGQRNRSLVALTFDDGPLPPYTGQILDVLERYGVRATFFCVGMNAKAYPEEVYRMMAAGHSVGNHTWSHPFLPELSYDQLRVQIDRTAKTIAAAGDGRPPTLFRPPYGSRTPQLVRWLNGIGATTVTWDVDSFDWMLPGTEIITRIIVEKSQPGSIALLHDGGGDRSQTVAALPEMIEGLLGRNFDLACVDDLLCPTHH